MVCSADANGAWLSANNGGYYHIVQICQTLGYRTASAWDGTCGNVCGYCQGATSCSNHGTEHSAYSVSQPDCGTDQYGGIFCYTIQWQCVK